jgi:hypothetical protein
MSVLVGSFLPDNLYMYMYKLTRLIQRCIYTREQKTFCDNKLPAYLALASSWLVFSKAESYYYPFYSEMWLLMIILVIPISFSDILFSSKLIQMVFSIHSFVIIVPKRFFFLGYSFLFFFILMYIFS